ncbi:hypothetical protein [uncultured Ruminococcus sp.]|uniref:hypothetical protein n=1 Tax=uncultured Ruminococcus sp. TaxID=165186 RepID=UPI00261CE816|nr:hypothetical protein [uncultured Ruminococcus sp.]
MEVFIDDNVVVPENIKKMSIEELKKSDSKFGARIKREEVSKNPRKYVKQRISGGFIFIQYLEYKSNARQQPA